MTDAPTFDVIATTCAMRTGCGLRVERHREGAEPDCRLPHCEFESRAGLALPLQIVVNRLLNRAASLLRLRPRVLHQTDTDHAWFPSSAARRPGYRHPAIYCASDGNVAHGKLILYAISVLPLLSRDEVACARWSL